MPKKKKVSEEPIEEEAPATDENGIEQSVIQSDPVENKVAELVKAQSDICNHQNLHYTGGELLCTLPKDHEGNHAGYIGDRVTEWSDEAGTPTRKHA